MLNRLRSTANANSSPAPRISVSEPTCEPCVKAATVPVIWRSAEVDRIGLAPASVAPGEISPDIDAAIKSAPNAVARRVMARRITAVLAVIFTVASQLHGLPCSRSLTANYLRSFVSIRARTDSASSADRHLGQITISNAKPSLLQFTAGGYLPVADLPFSTGIVHPCNEHRLRMAFEADGKVEPAKPIALVRHKNKTVG